MLDGYIPEGRIRAVIVDARINKEIEESLIGMGLAPIKTVEHPRLYPAIAYHPDTVICPVGGGRLVVEPTVFDYYREFLAPYRVELVKGERALSGNYPFNIAYNIATMGNRAILYARYADPVVLKELMRKKVELIHVKQGYAKCSTAIIHERAIITSDKGIAKRSREKGMDVLLIRPGDIRLEGFKYGFIGGCCGRIDSHTVVFTGNITNHPDWPLIKKFLKKYCIEPVSLYNGPLIDVGSIIPVVEIN